MELIKNDRIKEIEKSTDKMSGVGGIIAIVEVIAIVVACFYEWWMIVISVLLLVITIWIMFSIVMNNDKAIWKELVISNFNPSSYVQLRNGDVMAVNSNTSQIGLFYAPNSLFTYAFNQVEDCEYIFHEEVNQVRNTKHHISPDATLGYGCLGSLIGLKYVGAAVGAASSYSKTDEVYTQHRVLQMALKIVVDDIDHPVHYFDFDDERQAKGWKEKIDRIISKGGKGIETLPN